MTAHKVSFYSRLPSLGGEQSGRDHSNGPVPGALPQSSEPTTCTEAETFVLRVLDDSMQPEFRKGCIIVIDPTGIAREGSYVLARSIAVDDSQLAETDGYVFRQLVYDQQGQALLTPLNPAYPTEETPTDLSRVVGVIVQRAGTRRRYHKRYD